MDIKSAQSQFQQLVDKVDKSQLTGYLTWIKQNIDDTLKEASITNSDVIINEIRNDLRTTLPQDTTLQSENIVFPTVGDNADCCPASTVHMDGFLYDDDIIDDLVDEGKMSRNYCMKCGSHEVAPLTFISHSTSVHQLKYLFQFLLPDLQGKKLLDIGSRTGAILYGAYLYSGSSAIMGVEINPEFTQLQQTMIEKYNMTDRIKVICDDICNQAEVLTAADVIVMNNVFEFFAPLDVQAGIWQFIRQHVTRSGVLLVLSPSLEEALQNLQTDIDIDSWVEKIDLSGKLATANVHMFGSADSEEGELEDIHIYQVM